VTLQGLLDCVGERVPLRVRLDKGEGQQPWALVEGYDAAAVVISRAAPR